MSEGDVSSKEVSSPPIYRSLNRVCKCWVVE